MQSVKLICRYFLTSSVDAIYELKNIYLFIWAFLLIVSVAFDFGFGKVIFVLFGMPYRRKYNLYRSLTLRSSVKYIFHEICSHLSHITQGWRHLSGYYCIIDFVNDMIIHSWLCTKKTETNWFYIIMCSINNFLP